MEKRWTTCSKNIRSIKRWCNSRKFTAEPGQQKDRDETDKLFEPSAEAMKIQLKKVLKVSKKPSKAFEGLHVTLLQRSTTKNTLFDGNYESEIVCNPTQQQVFDYTFQPPNEKEDETNPNPASQTFSNGL